jgi:branched-chain amino acid transport system ATP-binding protein
MTTLLRLDGVEVAYGDMVAVRAATLEVRRGQIVSLIGSNGAGKTTTLRAVSGLLRPRRGTITLDSERIDGLPAAAIVARGIAHVPEGRQLFPTMTVRENLDLGAQTAASRRARAASLERVFALFPRLAEREHQLAGTLSGGEQQMTAIGRALMACPRLLLLDEPSLGLAPIVVTAIFENLARINGDGLTMLLVEQNVLRSLRLSHHAYVIDDGAIAFHGPAEQLLADERIRAAYLGR